MSVETIRQEAPEISRMNFEHMTGTKIVCEDFHKAPSGYQYSVYSTSAGKPDERRVSYCIHFKIDTSYWNQTRATVNRWNGERWVSFYHVPIRLFRVFTQCHEPGRVMLGADVTDDACRALAGALLSRARMVVDEWKEPAGVDA